MQLLGPRHRPVQLEARVPSDALAPRRAPHRRHGYCLRHCRCRRRRRRRRRRIRAATGTISVAPEIRRRLSGGCLRRHARTQRGELLRRLVAQLTRVVRTQAAHARRGALLAVATSRAGAPQLERGMHLERAHLVLADDLLARDGGPAVRAAPHQLAAQPREPAHVECGARARHRLAQQHGDTHARHHAEDAHLGLGVVEVRRAELDMHRGG
eukprot:scaffold43107_cov69-Phaeocystis_antarctica.AAC.12